MGWWRLIFFTSVFWCLVPQAAESYIFPPPGVTLPEYWGEKDVWWQGRTSFKGQIIVPACALAMEDTYQSIDLGTVPVRILQNSFAGPEKKFRLRLRNCELAGIESRDYTVSHVKIIFDGVQGETPDKFALIGQAEGINLQIFNNQGYPARVGKAMPPLLVNGKQDELDYTLRVVRNGQPLKAGNYYAVLRFRLDYE